MILLLLYLNRLSLRERRDKLKPRGLIQIYDNRLSRQIPGARITIRMNGNTTSSRRVSRRSYRRKFSGRKNQMKFQFRKPSEAMWNP